MSRRYRLCCVAELHDALELHQHRRDRAVSALTELERTGLASDTPEHRQLARLLAQYQRDLINAREWTRYGERLVRGD